MLGIALDAPANPTGMTVHGGSATATSSGSQLTVTTTSQSTFLNWQSFNIAAGETTIFQEPSTTSIVWNQINNANPSQIYGSLQANGIVVLLNSSGFYFGPNSFVSAAGLVVSTANCIPPQNSGGGWEFNGPPPLASIVNYGQINVGQGGSAFLIADHVENHGAISAPGGTIGLAAGQTVLLSERPDGRGMSMAVTLPSGSVDNQGRLIADGGTIVMNAKVVNQDGFIQANSVRNVNGTIELVASDQLTLGANSQIIASGDNLSSGSAGGNVTLQSGNNFSDSVGSQIITTGGTQGGNGGNVEISAPNVLSLNSSINARAQTGWTAGKLLLDPDYIILDTSGSGSVGSGTVLAGSNPGKTLDLNVNTAFANLAVSQIILQAVYDITLAGGTSWDLSGTIGANLGGVTSGQLTLEAGRNIIFGDGASISDANNWSVTLMAGVNNFNTGTIQTGTGNIYLNGGNGQTGSGSIQTASGSINLMAGNDIQIGSGIVSSSAGNITWQAGGDIQFGDGSQITDGNNGAVTLDAGYIFANNTVNFNVGNIYLNGGLGGDGVGGSIQTESGDINLTAGQNILVGSGCVITTGGGSIYAHALAGNIDTGSDAQGYYFSISSVNSLSKAYNLQDGLGGISTAAGGDVTLIAGGDVTSVLPGNGVYYYDGNPESPNNADYLTAGSGAYGSQAGNVTIVAGGNVTGNFLVANGTGAIYAGVKMVNGIPVDANGNPVTDGKSYVLDSGSTGSAGTADKELALNLITGGWTVDAAQNIYLQEVRNPNGVFDINGGRTFAHYFDYAASDYVDLNAGNLVQLGASPSVLPRPAGIKVPFIYPSILNITAGAGGVELVGGSTDPFNQLILFPSPQGSLTINTTDGGSLFSDLAASGGVPQILNLIVSDSSSRQLTTSSSDASCTFGINDHAASPVHLDASTPIELNISGDMSLVLLDAPEAAQINVVGNMYNCRFQGMNLSADDVTSINVGQTAKENMENSGLLDPKTDSGITVGGDIINRGNFTSVTLDLTQTGVQAPDMDYLSEAVNNAIGSTSISAATLLTSLYFNPNTGVLTYQNISGVSIASVLNLLQNLTVQVYKNGVPQWADPLDTIPQTTAVSVLTPATAQALLAQYNAENAYSRLPAGSGPPDGTYGFTIGGGGQFNITARTIDLGTTAGIQSEGVGLYTVRGTYPLAQLFGAGGVFDHGADITITTTGNHSAGETAGDLVGDLDMYSSSIASLQGGDITIYAGGDVNAGSADFSVNTTSARGIYSTDQGNVFVYADGDFNVNGSRIGVYDTRQDTDNSSGTPGGSVTVVSRNGNINAGTGGSGFVNVSSFQVNADQSVNAESLTIPGSGIMNVSYSQPGNILVEAPNGSVNAAAGGIIQLALNGAPLPEGTTLFGVPLNRAGLAKMFDLALNGKTKAALALQKVLNGNPGNSAVDIFAGYELQQLDGSGNPIVDAYGDPVITALNLSDGTLEKTSDNQDITATGSGVLANGSVNMDASGDISGTIYTQGNGNLHSDQTIIVDLIAGGKVDITASSLGDSQIVGLQGIDATGDTSDASLMSNDQVSGGQDSLAAGTAADAASQGMASETSASLAKSDDTTSTDDDEKKKKGKAVATVQKAGRVTVLLPPKHLSQNQTSSNHL
ncbi:MAG: filamentous hemagglutinin N-terminal domain-containing protein [Verrucomicrobiota bacterium]|jgi:filamentous hemagglutinin family protein